MKDLARWAWVVVLGTALSLSWWSLDALSRRYGMPALLAGMVSAAIDGAALVASNIALQRATAADSAAGAKLFMICTVGLSAWLNFQHGLLLHYPFAVRVLFAAPSVISGWLLELQLRNLHRARLRELDRVARPLPRFGMLIWCFHPFAALRRLSQIASSRLRSVPVSVMNWTPAPMTEIEEGAVTADAGHPMMLAAPVESAGQGTPEPGADEKCATRRTGRTPVPDEQYMAQLRELVAEAEGMVPSAREVARQLSIGQERARRLVTALRAEQANTASDPNE